MSYTITKIEGIGPTYGAKLNDVGIKTTGSLLKRCAERKGRQDVASETGLDEKLILKWTNMADLMRIKGVGEEYSELLEAAGVDTVKELATRNPVNLAEAIVKANGERKLVRQVPGQSAVASWVKQAKSMKPAISY